jgi:GNAT superfamily N-acetyltransferase
MAAVEEWARGRGAELVMLQTWADSPESVPFYERIGYRRRAIIFQKQL